jgi:hypothetical protein
MSPRRAIPAGWRRHRIAQQAPKPPCAGAEGGQGGRATMPPRLASNRRLNLKPIPEHKPVALLG